MHVKYNLIFPQHLQHGGQGGVNQLFTKCVSMEKDFKCKHGT